MRQLSRVPGAPKYRRVGTGASFGLAAALVACGPSAGSGDLDATSNDVTVSDVPPATDAPPGVDATGDAGTAVECVRNPARMPYAPGTTARTLTHGGRTRNYLVHLPPGYTPDRGYPLVLMVHGYGPGPRDFMTKTRMPDVADREGFIAVFPEGTPGRLPGAAGVVFNAGFNAGALADATVDDVGFVRALVASLESDFNVDCSRVYAGGHSMGAMMTYRLAAELPRTFAAFGVVAGTMGSTAPDTPDAVQTETPVVSLPVVVFHAVDDPAVAYLGCAEPRSTYFPVIDPQACAPNTSVGYYRDTINGCTGETTSMPAATVTLHAWTTCRELGVSMEFYQLATGRHAWPGSADSDANRDVDASAAMWRFFARHRRP
jgi:polyhydroxybutyrate depolymerase